VTDDMKSSLSYSLYATSNGHSVSIHLKGIEDRTMVILTPDEALNLAAFINASLVVPISTAATT